MRFKTVVIYVEGTVQGVFYRASTKSYADTLQNVGGFVKNLNDGRVYITATGPKSEIEKLLKWCEKGPEHAKVNNLNIEWQDELRTFDGFEIEY